MFLKVEDSSFNVAEVGDKFLNVNMKKVNLPMWTRWGDFLVRASPRRDISLEVEG